MTQWYLGGKSTATERFLLRETDDQNNMDGVVYPGENPEWVPGDNSRGFTAAELRQIASIVEGAFVGDGK